jgi:hypothetical protein
MTINEFMNSNIQAIKADILTLLDETFDSHCFIRKFAKRYESQYVDFLTQYSENQHQNVHKIIAKNLQTNKRELEIQDNGKVYSENCFGEINLNEGWKKM